MSREARGRALFDKANRRWVSERGFDSSLPKYAILGNGDERMGRLYGNIPLSYFRESYRSHAPQLADWREVCVLAEGQDANLLVRFVVTALRPIQSPLETETVEAGRVVYAEHPDWVGMGVVLDGDRRAPRKVVNRVRFCLEAVSGRSISGGDIQFIDRQPQVYR